jgi:hypothetical protein
MAVLAEDLVFDKKEQLEKIEDICLPDEVIRAVFDLKGAGSGFIGITDKRIIFYDKAFFKSQRAMVSIPYSRITSIGSEDNKGFLIKRGFLVSDKLTICAQGVEPKVFEFRGGDKAHLAHRLLMEYLLK